MKILVDSCVWSYALRRSGCKLSQDEQRLVSSLADGIKEGVVVVVGPIRQEVLSGLKSVSEFDKLFNALFAFPDEPIESVDYVQAARLFNLCRRAGVQCGTVDMLLCAVAQRNKWSILTNDAGMQRCIEAMKQNKT